MKMNKYIYNSLCYQVIEGNIYTVACYLQCYAKDINNHNYDDLKYLAFNDSHFVIYYMLHIQAELNNNIHKPIFNNDHHRYESYSIEGGIIRIHPLTEKGRICDSLVISNDLHHFSIITQESYNVKNYINLSYGFGHTSMFRMLSQKQIKNLVIPIKIIKRGYTNILKWCIANHKHIIGEAFIRINTINKSLLMALEHNLVDHRCLNKKTNTKANNTRLSYKKPTHTIAYNAQFYFFARYDTYL